MTGSRRGQGRGPSSHARRRARRRALGVASVMVAAAWLAASGAWGIGGGSRAVAPSRLSSLEIAGLTGDFDAGAQAVDAGEPPGSAGEVPALVNCGDLAVWIGPGGSAVAATGDGPTDLILDLRVRNDGSRTLTVTPLDFSVRDQLGELWEGMSRRVASQSAFPAAALEPGEEVGGVRRFTLPAGRVAVFLHIQRDGGGSAVEVGLPALQAPSDDPPVEAGTLLAEEHEVSSGDG